MVQTLTIHPHVPCTADPSLPWVSSKLAVPLRRPKLRQLHRALVGQAGLLQAFRVRRSRIRWKSLRSKTIVVLETCRPTDSPARGNFATGNGWRARVRAGWEKIGPTRFCEDLGESGHSDVGARGRLHSSCQEVTGMAATAPLHWLWFSLGCLGPTGRTTQTPGDGTNVLS